MASTASLSSQASRSAWRGQPRDAGLRPVLAVLWLLVALFVLYPLLRLVGQVFWGESGFTFAIIAQILSHWMTWAALWNSILLAVLVGVLGTALGLVFALLAVRADVPRAWRLVTDAVILLPLVSPPFTAAISFILAFGPRGLISYEVFGFKDFVIYGLHGTLLAETLTYFPLAYLTLKGVLSNANLTVEDAAYSLGAGRWHVFRTVTLPLTIPGLANSFLLLSAASLADFATPLVLGSAQLPVLPTQAYLQITGLYDIEGGAALAFLLLFPAFGIYLLQRAWIGERSYVSITGKMVGASGQATISLPVKIGLMAVAAAVIATILTLYGLIAYASVVRVLGVDHTLTWQNYAHVLTNGRQSFIDTLIVGAVSMPVGGIFAVVLGYILCRFQFRGRRALEFASMLDYALPGTIVGIAFLISFSSAPLALTGGLTILVACYVFRYSLTGTRTTIALLQQVDPAIEEASASLGGGPLTTFRRVVLPLVLPALAAGMAVLFIRAMTAISATIFLVSLNWSLVTVRILDGITNVDLGQASAYSVVVIVLVFLAVFLTGLLLRALTRGQRQQAGMILG